MGTGTGTGGTGTGGPTAAVLNLDEFWTFVRDCSLTNKIFRAGDVEVRECVSVCVCACVCVCE